jgi:uncharacterized membrane protein
MENRVIIGVILLTGFILAVSAASMYAQSHILSGTACGCQFPVEMLIPILSSAGILVGSMVYYFMSAHGKAKKEVAPLFSLIDYDQKKVIEALVKSNGSMPQSKLVAATGMNKVKISRVVADLEARGAIRKSASGMTNMVELEGKLKKLLL